MEVLVSIDRKFLNLGSTSESPEEGAMFFWLGLSNVDVPVTLEMAANPTYLDPEQRKYRQRVARPVIL